MHNQEFDINKVVDVLKGGGTILYPTDTIWGIGCDATNSRAVEKVYRIKERLLDKSLIILVSDLNMLQKYVKEVPEIVVELISSVSEPLTVIYPEACNLPKNLMAQDGSIAIRIPNHQFCQKLLHAFGRPVTSTSANVSGAPNPHSYRVISQEIKKEVDFIVPLEQDTISRPKPSSIVRIDETGEMHILRN
ncbi:MAG: L-threonylcarbamoyladenylate synthase [Bacteroidales bacterium]